MNILFFEKVVTIYEKYSIPYFLQKSVYLFLPPDTPFLSKWSCPLTNVFSQFFQHKLNIHKIFLLKKYAYLKEDFVE